MRKILGTCIFFVSCVAFALAQRGGPGGGGGFDPNALFDKISQGQASIVIANSGFSKTGLEEYARQNNITSGQITRAQFADYMTNRDKYRTAGGPGGGKRGNFGGPSQMTPGGGPTLPGAAPAAPGAPPVNPIEAINQAAEAEFKHRDANGDGYLNFDEMPRSLREQIERWDINGDGLISLDEFRQYYAARMQMRGGNMGDAEPGPITIIIEDDLDKRPTVFRAGKLPKELPKWFKELDTDKDGQIAFHEWRHAGKDLEEFKEWDRNDDGFITAEEVLSKMRVDNLAKLNADPGDSETSASEEGGGPPREMRGGKGMRGGDRGDGNSGDNGGGKKGRGNFGGGGAEGGGKKGRGNFADMFKKKNSSSE
jgi:Ca2+-binding EF-hand superfamily protein